MNIILHFKIKKLSYYTYYMSKKSIFVLFFALLKSILLVLFWFKMKIVSAMSLILSLANLVSGSHGLLSSKQRMTNYFSA